MKKARRIISFILTCIMVFSSLNLTSVVYATEQNYRPGAAGDHHGISGGYTYSSDVHSTGYKLTLVFLPVEGIDGVTTEEELKQKIDDAWNEATPEDAMQVGNTIYLTRSGYKGDVAYGFQFGGFKYGLGNRTGALRKTGANYDIKPIDSKVFVTPEEINSTLASLNLPSLNKAGASEGYSANSMNMDANLPINMGEDRIPGSLSDYFMRPLTAEEQESDEGITGTDYATASFAGLINYIATYEGSAPDGFVYFSRIKDNGATSQLHKYDDAIPDNADWFEQGRYRGNNGEYRLIVEPYWNIKIPELTGNKRAALTLRDIAFLCDNGYAGVGNDQRYYYADLGYTTRLARDDIWGLKVTQESDWKGNTSGTTTLRVKANLGGGLAFFTSSMMQAVLGSPGYIGSITNVFLPGALTDDNQNISVASMEYIGDKEKPEDVEPFMQQVASMIAGAGSGIDFPGSSNILNNSIDLTRDAILNGSIKLPGINPDDINNEDGQRGLIEQLDSLIDEYETTPTGASAVGAAIKDMLRNELGIDVDNPTASSVNMQDFNLAVYVLARYGMTGVNIADDEGNYAYAAGDVYNMPENRSRQPFVLAALMNNESTRQAIEANESGKWDGPMSITKEDMNQTLGVPNKFSTHVLKDEADNQLQNNYEDSVTGIDSAIKEKNLDDVSNGGQITIVQNEYAGDVNSLVIASEDTDVWRTMLNPPELEEGLLKRVPVAVGNTQLFFGAGADLKQPVELPKGLIPTVVGGALQNLYKNYINVSEQADQISSYEGETIENSVSATLLTNAPQIGINTGDTDDIAKGKGALAPLLGNKNNTTFMPITNTTSFDSSYRIGTSAYDEDKSIAFNTFGMNTLINTYTMGLFQGMFPNTDETPVDSDYKWLGKLASQLYTANSKYAVPHGSENTNGIFAAPTYSTNEVLESNPNATALQIADNVKGKFTAMNPATLIINDAVFNNMPLGDDTADPSAETNSLLAASNYYLNRGLASTEATVKTNKVKTLISDDDGSGQTDHDSNTTQLKGDYGISYVVYDAAMPIDIQFATEVDGQIVPLELASDVYDNTLISNVWYASPNLDKVVQLQKYYTVKDKKGKAHTLEVEEAVVKSATISEKDELQKFYDEYTKAYNNNDENMFTVSTTSKNGEDTQIYPRTKRTVLKETDADKLNTGAYTATHKDDSLASILRYIVAGGENLGMPSPGEHLTNSLYNAITITPSIYDKEAYLADPTANRLQVIVKVRALSDIVQYNMIQGLSGDYVEEVTPDIEDGKVVIDNSIQTNTGNAARTPYDTDNPANNGRTGTQSSVFMLERDVDPNSERDDWTWEGFKNSKDETGKYRFLDDNNRPTQPEIDTQWMNPPILNLGGDDPEPDINEPLDIPDGTRAIYVRYVENPPLYEIYRDKSGNETVRRRDKIINSDGYIQASKGGTSDNLMNDGTPYYPVMAVAADINFDPAETNNVVEKTTFSATDDEDNEIITDEVKLNNPADWDWVMKNVADYGINSSGLWSGTNPVKAAEGVSAAASSAVGDSLFDVQVVGVNGLYHKFVESGSPDDENYNENDEVHKGDKITLTQIVNGKLGSDKAEDGRGFGYSPSLASAPETFHTFEYPGNIEIEDKRFPNPGTNARTASVLKPSFSGSGPYTDGINASLFYPAEYVNDLPNYVIYILYVQDETEPVVSDNSFYAILPQDMVTRAVAYKDLARQYYQKIQSAGNAYDASFEKWYTLYMTIGSDKVYRVDRQTGDENGYVHIGKEYENVDFDSAWGHGDGDKVSFGPLSKGVDNRRANTTAWRRWYKKANDIDDMDDVPSAPDGFDKYTSERDPDNLKVTERQYSYKSDGSVKVKTKYKFDEGWYFVPNRCVEGKSKNDVIDLFDSYTLNFGIQKQNTKYYELIGGITPMTVGITNPKFSSTSNYIKEGIPLAQNTDEYYWTDTFHYYKDYNFYITVWRGNDQVVFAAAPSESEQKDVAKTQKDALKELNEKPINEITTTEADGSTHTDAFGFNSQSLTGSWYQMASDGSGVAGEKTKNYWQENMYPANIYMGPDITDLHDPEDGALEEMGGKKAAGFVNSYAYGFTNGDLQKDGTYLLPPRVTEYKSNGDRSKETSYDTFSQTSLPDSGSSQIQMSASDGVKNSFTAFHGYLLIQNMVDGPGEGHAKTDPDSAANVFSVNGGDYYNDRDIQFQKSKTLTIPNTWNDSTGGSIPIWVNWYPWVKMRYQTVDSNEYYTPDTGGSPVETKNVYALSANQSTMQLNSAVEIGFNRGTYRDAHGEYQDYDIDPAKANRITVQSTQWSTHQNALKNVIHEPGFEDGEEGRSAKGTVLPGGAIYTLTIGAINDSSGYDAGPDAHLARSKVGIQYYKPYVPKSMQNALAETNRVGEHTRYTNKHDAEEELNKAKARYSIQNKNVTQDPTYRGLVEATMQTINNTSVALSLGDDPEAAHVDGNAYDHTDPKYRLGRGDGADGSAVTETLTVPLNNDEKTKALSGEHSAGNSASLDSLSFVQDTPIFCRVWSDTEGNVYFGWRENANQPTIEELLGYLSKSPTTENGCIRIVEADGRIEESPVHWVYDPDTKQYVYNDKTAGAGVPYKVDASTRLISNYVNATERAIGLADDASNNKQLSAGNAADSTHLQYDIAEEKVRADTYAPYAGMLNGNEVGSVAASNYNQLVSGFNAQGWNVLTEELKDEIEKTIHNAPPGTGIGYKWLEHNSKVKGGTDYQTDHKWYNEASDGFGVVILRGIIEVGFGGPKPSSGVTGGTSANEPVRTTIIDPEWQPKHTDRSSLFTAFRSGHIYTESDSIQHFYTNIYGTASGDTAPTMPGDTPEDKPAALGVQTDKNEGSRYWLYLDPEGFGYLYRSKKFFIPNGSVMDLN